MLQKAPMVGWKPGGFPVVSANAFIHETAVLMGDVVIKDGVAVYPLAVLRADEGFPIVIGEYSNVQDGVVIHCLKGGSVTVGQRCSLAHGAIIHGPCEIGDETFVGFRAMVVKSRLGRGCFVGHGALVNGVEIPDGKYVPSLAVVTTSEHAAALPEVSREQLEFVREVFSVNRELCDAYLNLHRRGEPCPSKPR
ncbi:carbonic anhydrase/acetyltransferase-like protein (isoleucine patch superfamily) [Desulfofundulus luciae]|uniref:Carbonic anhydrase/acetyltransferase-like protein (Isoleucine patch superfamily) n=1 Tax=Desulfofundulus luciae TaxID=74702 RepID=A0ABU0B3H6_9FIRM|nr:transferase [Desulfofundulus luciae]MDQ0287267.1 carbonic anhydrase/acetyltransferase-like protein (isoleucine patch superfamily) [Desulfofundulus luciae]